MGLYRFLHIGCDSFDLRGLEAEGGLVADEARRDGEDGLFDLQIIFHQRFSSLHDVYDDIGEPQDGGDLNGAVEVDDVDLAALVGVVPSRDVGEFGGDLQGLDFNTTQYSGGKV